MTGLRIAAATALLALWAPLAQALLVLPTSDPGALAGVLVGSGITIVPGSARFTGADGAAGTFTGGRAAGLGIEGGILLTTGLAELAAGPNADSGSGFDHSGAGDADLSALAGYETFDAASLAFDFESAGGDLYFNYVFASEEYNEYSNTEYNDLFAFFLDGRNLALLPGSGTPVGVNTVNRGNPDDGTPAANPEYFVDNDGSYDEDWNWLPSSHFDLEYDGFTTVLTAQALGLAPGAHHIRLAIADASDGIYDSAVFLQAGTFADTATPAAAPEPGTLALLGTGLGLLAALRRQARAV